MMKKLGLVILIAGIVGGGGYAAYSYYYIAAPESAVVAKKEKKVTQISRDIVISPVSSFNSNALWYGISDGRVMRYNLNDEVPTEYPMPQAPAKHFSQILWPPQGNDFIAVSKTSDKVTYNYYNFQEKKYYTLPENVLALDWLSDSRRVVMVWKSGDGKAKLVISNADGSGYKVLRDLPWLDLVPKASPKDNTALLVRASAHEETNKIYLFDLDTGEYEEIIKTGLNRAMVWSPRGDRFLYTQEKYGEAQVYVYDFLSKVSKEIDANISLDKVSFDSSGDKLVYASTVSTDDVESILEHNLTTGSFKTLYLLSSGLQAKNLLTLGQTIFFQDGRNNLYKIE